MNAKCEKRRVKEDSVNKTYFYGTPEIQQFASTKWNLKSQDLIYLQFSALNFSPVITSHLTCKIGRLLKQKKNLR